MERGLLEDLIKEHLEAQHLLTISQLAKHLRDSGYQYNRSSVYRAVERLLDEGEICRHHLNDKHMYYELRDRHDHLVCELCGKVLKVHSVYEAPKNVGSFKVDHHHLTLYGVCHDCK